jgi:hypothetical protein
MPSFNIQIVEKIRSGSGIKVVFCDHDNPGLLYTTEETPDTVSGQREAIQALVSLRKAAGIDYPGRPVDPINIITVEV